MGNMCVNEAIKVAFSQPKGPVKWFPMHGEECKKIQMVSFYHFY